tara:strand:+ start:458 stop:685 length:228 start_codon:yes stop_codon:yes gene_type:complete
MAEENTITEEQIAQNYAAMGHSVNLLNAGKPDDMEADEWTARKVSNVEHLELMVAKDYWTDEDMTEVNKAIADNK